MMATSAIRTCSCAPRRPSGNLRVRWAARVWVPGKDAPSVAGSAISVDVARPRLARRRSRVAVVHAGFRLDNSAKSVDDPTRLSIQDRVSLGVSEFNAVVGGVHLAIPVGPKAFLGVEGSLDLFVGSGATPAGATAAHEAPGPLIRFGASARLQPDAAVRAARVRRGREGPRPAALRRDGERYPADPVRADDHRWPRVPGAVRWPEATAAARSSRTMTSRRSRSPSTADVSGEIVDELGKPVVGAKVDVKLKNNTGTGVTDDKGAYVIEKLPIGQTVEGVTTLDDVAAEVSVDVSGKKPATPDPHPRQGCEPGRPDHARSRCCRPGSCARSCARWSPASRSRARRSRIEPGALTATSEADGTFSVDLAPGQYKIAVSSPGLKDQVLDVTIDPNGVAIKNIELLEVGPCERGCSATRCWSQSRRRAALRAARRPARSPSSRRPTGRSSGRSATRPGTRRKVGARFYVGDAARTADGAAYLAVLGSAKITMQPHTVLRFGGQAGEGKIAVELGAIDLSGTGSYGLDIGDVRLSKGSVRVTAQRRRREHRRADGRRRAGLDDRWPDHRSRDRQRGRPGDGGHQGHLDRRGRGRRRRRRCAGRCPGDRRVVDRGDDRGHRQARPSSSRRAPPGGPPSPPGRACSRRARRSGSAPTPRRS